MKTILITGVAGFIGSAVARILLDRGDTVLGIDNLNDYYDVKLKKDRLKTLSHDNFTFMKAYIEDKDALDELTKEKKIDCVVHIAAQAGVRYSIDHPIPYEKTNLLGTLNMLELCRNKNIPDMVFSSSSSVYGGITTYPYHEKMNVNAPVSLYAATKAAGELMCYSYHKLYGTRFRILRFFTVYGPFGRPDMALFTFTKKILAGEKIDVYNKGKMYRDFTYIDDISAGVIASIDTDYQYEVFNLARGKSEKLLTYIKVLEQSLGKKAKMNLMPIQKGDVLKTSADISKAKKMLGYDPKTGIKKGVKAFVDWYTGYYH